MIRELILRALKWVAGAVSVVAAFQGICQFTGACPVRRAPHRDAVQEWLMCIDCRSGQIDSLLSQLRRQYVPTVTGLTGHLLDGPGAVRLAAFERASKRVHFADSVYAVRNGRPLPIPQDQFVERYRVRYDRLWRTRAALALGVVRALPPFLTLDSAAGNLARSALDSALALLTLDALARRWVLYARDSIPPGTNPYGVLVGP